jgi:hypothetical protein
MYHPADSMSAGRGIPSVLTDIFKAHLSMPTIMSFARSIFIDAEQQQLGASYLHF